MNSDRNKNFAKPVWPETESFVDMRSGQTKPTLERAANEAILKANRFRNILDRAS